MPSSDESKIDDNVIKNKIVFSTFHQAKGRERKVVIVYGFDNSYYEYYDKEAKEDECPQNLYVACTRASLRLFLIESIDKKPLPFLKLSKEELEKSNYIDYREEKQQKRTRKPKEFTFHKTSPTDLVKFIKQENLTIINKLVKQLFTNIREKGKIIEIPLVIETSSGNHEQISDLNGLVIPAILEARQHGITSLHKEIDIEIKNGLFIEMEI
jgi:ATP-dependent exoDNAse (exonuclease V) beta subunit